MRKASSSSAGPSNGASASKENFVHRLFDQISPRYDLFNRLSSFGLDQGWRRRTIASLQLAPGAQVLDLASGTGDLAIAAAQEILPLGQVVAFDLSHPMLALGRQKFQQIPAAHWHIRSAQGRAESLPFADRSFAATTMGFALRNVSDLDTVFREIHRVLKPGARIALLEFGRPRNPWLALGSTLWMSTGVPILGWLTTGALWPFLYLRRSIHAFPAPPEIVCRLAAAGFARPQALPLTSGIVTLYTAQK